MDSFVQLLERGVAIIAPLQALVAGTCFLVGLVFVARSIVGMARSMSDRLDCQRNHVAQ